MAIDELLKLSGDFGPAQWWLLSLFCAVNILSSFHYFAQTFISLTPERVCGIDISNCTFLPLLNETKELCIYDEEDWHFETIPIQLNWICEEDWKMALVQSMFFMGSVIGTLILGILADTFGRIPMLALANVLAVTGNILTIYLPPNMWFFGLARFIAGLATDTNFFMMYIIVMEYIRPSMRTFGLNLTIGVWYCIGSMITPWLAVWANNWRTFLLSISIPMLLIPVSSYFMPESAQWLLSRGKVDEAIKCFKNVANFNGKKISADFINQFKSSDESSESPKIVHFDPEKIVMQQNFQITYSSTSNSSNMNANLTGLFKTPCLRKKTCILIFKTMVLTLCYDAMARNIEGLNMSPFTVFTITSASIFPSCLVILLFQDKIGRKAMAVFSLFVTSILNFGQGIFLLFSNDLPYIAALIGLFGRFAVNIAYNSGTQYAAELIPTQVRGQGLAAMHVVGYIAAFFSPQILYLSKKWIATPEMILGIFSIAGSAFCLFLPETLNKALPVTLEDGEVFGEDEGIWDFMILRNNNKKKNEKKMLQHKPEFNNC